MPSSSLGLASLIRGSPRETELPSAARDANQEEAQARLRRAGPESEKQGRKGAAVVPADTSLALAFWVPVSRSPETFEPEKESRHQFVALKLRDPEALLY